MNKLDLDQETIEAIAEAVAKKIEPQIKVQIEKVFLPAVLSAITLQMKQAQNIGGGVASIIREQSRRRNS